MEGYLHERAGWPHLTCKNEELMASLAAVRHCQGRLLGRMQEIGFDLRDEAVFQTLTRDVLETSLIEGELLDKEQVRSSLAHRLGLDIGALTPTDRSVDGIVEMLLDATQNYKAPLTVERLFGWHSALFPTGYSGMTRIRVGLWRDDSTGPMQVVSGPIGRNRVHFEAPAAVRLPHEIASFLDWFNDGTLPLDPVLKAGLAHLWFVTLHPFEDGNGRIARAIGDLALARSEETAQRFYSLSAQIRLERNAYYETLERTQKGDVDVTSWLSWFLGCLDRAIGGAETALTLVLRKAQFWNAAASKSLNNRQRLILNQLIGGFEGKLTSSKWAKIAKCSQDTALRDIQDLLYQGLLMQTAGGGRSTGYELADTV